MREKLKVLIVASESNPFIKSGGLGDVVGSLPLALQQKGVDARVVIPRHKDLKDEHLSDVEYLGDVEVNLGWRNHTAKILKKPSEVPVYFIENDFYFNRVGLYGYDDDNERYAFFSKSALELIEKIDFYPDVIHCNDWQTAPVCIYLKEIYSKTVYYSKIKTLFTIHNLQYQGSFPSDTYEVLDVPAYCYDGVEFHNNVNFMKMGLCYCDAISTVSGTYSYEIQEYANGYGMDGLLRSRNDILKGILNGINTEENNPETDDRIVANFSVKDLSGKLENKRWIQEKMGLEKRDDVPMVAMITRLADQKGLDILTESFHEMMKNDIQFVLIGTGEPRFEGFFKDMEEAYKGKVKANIFFDERLAQKVYAGADMFLMPSLFEPCGLGQMFSLRYGTVPIVRKTGGLADTISHYNYDTKEGNGFVFESYDKGGILWAVYEAVHAYRQGKKVWEKIVVNAMKSDYSMEKMAGEYISLYNSMINEDEK